MTRLHFHNLGNSLGCPTTESNMRIAAHVACRMHGTCPLRAYFCHTQCASNSQSVCNSAHVQISKLPPVKHPLWTKSPPQTLYRGAPPRPQQVGCTNRSAIAELMCQGTQAVFGWAMMSASFMQGAWRAPKHLNQHNKK